MAADRSELLDPSSTDQDRFDPSAPTLLSLVLLCDHSDRFSWSSETGPGSASVHLHISDHVSTQTHTEQCVDSSG